MALPSGRPLKVSQLIDWAIRQGWTQEGGGAMPIYFRDASGLVRLKLKKGSSRTKGSEMPHAEFRNGNGQRIDINGNLVSRRSKANHTPIVWDI